MACKKRSSCDDVAAMEHMATHWQHEADANGARIAELEARVATWAGVESLTREWMAARQRHDDASIEFHEADMNDDAERRKEALGPLDHAAGEMMRLEWLVVRKCWQVVDPEGAPKGDV